METRLKATATEWEAAHRDPGFLLSGSRLDLFEAWSAATDIRLDAPERELLDASLAERRRVESAERDRRDQERRLERRAATWLRALVAVLLVAVVGASGLLAVVWRQAEGAREDRAIATARELAVAANGRLDVDPALSLLLAVEAARATADRGWITEEALDALHWAIQETRIPYPIEAAPSAIRIARDGPRGVYLLPGADLIELAATGAGRVLTIGECRAYLHQSACPVAGQDLGDGDLRVMTASGPVAMEALADAGSPGASVRVFSQLPADVAGALADHAAEGWAISITSDGGATDPGPAVEQADVAILVRPGDVADLARAGSLMALDDILSPAEVAALQAAPLADLGWVERARRWLGWRRDQLRGRTGRGHGLKPAVVPGRRVREGRLRASGNLGRPGAARGADDRDGRTPWCLGLVGGEHDGANGADLIEDLVLDRLATEWYDKWAVGPVQLRSPAGRGGVRAVSRPGPPRWRRPGRPGCGGPDACSMGRPRDGLR